MNGSKEFDHEIKQTGKSTTFDKHTPVYPLPAEILNMSRDETICQFCGVSYLIHNEIKKLEERIKELEANLADYKILKLKEKQYEQINEEYKLKVDNLEEKLITTTQMLTSVNNDLKSRDIDINRLKSKTQEMDNEKYLLVADNENLKTKLIKYESVVKETMLNLSNVKSDLKSIEIDIKDKYYFIKQNLLEFQLKTTQLIKHISTNSAEKLDEISKLKSELEILNKEKHSFNETLNSYVTKIDVLEKVKNELNLKVNALSNESQSSKDVFSKLLNAEKNVRMLMQENSELKAQNESFKTNATTFDYEINDLNHKINDYSDRIRSMEIKHEKESRSKADEINTLKLELESYKKRYTEKDSLEKELMNSYQSNMNELNGLKREINRLNDLLIETENEKNSMVLSHQLEITQLKDSFRDKMKGNEDWTVKMSQELNRQREKFTREMQTMENELKKNFNAELEVNAQKYNDMCLKYQALSKELDHSSRARITDLEMGKQKLINELRNLHEEKVENENRFKKESENLKNIVKVLHEKLEKYTDDSSEFDLIKLKEDLVRKDQILFEYENKIKSYEVDLENNREEIRVLQETVHKECLERDELLEKLNSTKDELFLFKKSAYASKKLVPLNPIQNNSNKTTSEFKHSSSDVKDANNNMTLNTSFMKNSTDRKLFNNSQSGSSNDSRRNSYSANLANNVTAKDHNNNTSYFESGKSSADSKARPAGDILGSNRASLLNMNQRNFPSEPIELFKKINELKSIKDNANKNSAHRNSLVQNSNTENKKRISLLLGRKS